MEIVSTIMNFISSVLPWLDYIFKFFFKAVDAYSIGEERREANQ